MSHKPDPTTQKPPLSLGKFIGLMIVFAVIVVVLFGGLVFAFATGAQKLGLSTPIYIAIFLVISAILAWLLKRVSDAAADLSRAWFPEDTDPTN